MQLWSSGGAARPGPRQGATGRDALSPHRCLRESAPQQPSTAPPHPRIRHPTEGDLPAESGEGPSGGERLACPAPPFSLTWSPGDEKPTSHPRQDIRLAKNKVTPARQQGHTVKLGSHPGFDSMPTSCPGHPEPGCEQAVRATGPCGQTRTARKRPGTRASRALRPAPCEAAQEPGAEARVPGDSTARCGRPWPFGSAA